MERVILIGIFGGIQIWFRICEFWWFDVKEILAHLMLYFRS